MAELTARIKVETSELDQANEKAELLVETLKKAKSLADELAGNKLELGCEITCKSSIL